MKTLKIMFAVIMLALLVACGSTTTTTNSAQPTAASAVQPTAATNSQPTAVSATNPTATSSKTTASTTAKLNLNTVTESELTSTIPNFPSRMVREFFEYRPYISITQFRKEIGKYVDAATVTGYEQYVYVPVSVNDSDGATLQQLPGVDATIAETLIAGRPYANNDAFLTKLATLVSADQATAAKAYLAQ